MNIFDLFRDILIILSFKYELCCTIFTIKNKTITLFLLDIMSNFYSVNYVLSRDPHIKI